MSSQFFEGAAGTGKTYSLMRSLESLVIEHPLEKHQKVLALTFMHGSRSRLDDALLELKSLNRRFDCMTFDAFAGYIVNRWRDLLSSIRLRTEISTGNNEYEQTCFEAAELLKEDIVQRWVSQTHPIVLVDEAQDLSLARLTMMQGLAASSILLAAADEYQHLDESHGDNEAVQWLSSNINTQCLTQPKRTSDQGLLQVALNLKNAEAIMPLLSDRAFGRKQMSNFTLVSVHNYHGLAWHAGYSLFQSGGNDHAILTLSSNDTHVNNAIHKIKTQPQNLNKKRGTTFGPFPDIHQTLKVDVLADECIASLDLSDSIMPIESALSQCVGIEDIHIKETIENWIKKRRKILGQTECLKEELELAIKEAFQNRKRYQRGLNRKRQTMTIHQAKNREFDNVIVLWTYALPGDSSDEYKRRLLYNAITRAKQNCTVIVMGENRLSLAPFSIDARAIARSIV